MTSIDRNWVDNHIDSNGEVIIPDGVEKIEAGAFKNNQAVKKVIMPDTIVEIGVDTFKNCKQLKQVKLGNNIKSIGQLSFANSGIEQIELPLSLEKIEILAFGNCSNLQKVLGGKNISTIETAAFQGTKITEFEIPNQITTIKANVFGQNPNLSSITLNSELDFLSERAFCFSDNLQEINIKGTQRINYGAFMNKPNVHRINIDGQEFTLADNEQLFSLQKVGNKVAIVIQDEEGKFFTRGIDLEEQTDKTIYQNTYLTEEGKLCFARNSISDFSLFELKQYQKLGLSKIYIYGGDNEIMPSEHKKGMNFNLYNLDDLIQIKTRIEELKKQIIIPNEQDKHREQKIYGQIIRLLSENIEYDDWGAETPKEKYEIKTRKKL